MGLFRKTKKNVVKGCVKGDDNKITKSIAKSTQVLAAWAGGIAAADKISSSETGFILDNRENEAAYALYAGVGLQVVSFAARLVSKFGNDDENTEENTDENAQ